MALPTKASRGLPVSQEISDLHDLIVRAREIAVTWQTTLIADTGINDILRGIYVPYAASAAENGIWHALAEAQELGGFYREFLQEIELYYEFGPADVKTGNDRIAPGANSLAIDDPVRLEEHDVLPSPFVAGTTYYIKDKTAAGALTFAAAAPTAGEPAIDITTTGTGSNVLRYAPAAEINALEAALEAVIDEIVNVVPEVAVTAEIRAEKFDKALAFGATGLVQAVLTPAQTAPLRLKLADVQNAIEAPV